MKHRNTSFWDTPISRREALIRGGSGLAALGAMGLGATCTAQGSETHPNIVVILSDDHRWDALGVMDHPVLETPSLDRLAAEGILFENAFCTTSLCSPSRASFLTGLYAHTHGVQNNMTPWDNDNVTFLEELHGAGYETAFIGKWHMPGNFPELRGLDRFITFTADGGQGRYFDCPLIVDGREVETEKSYITEVLTDYAVEFIKKEHDSPFCLFLSHKAAHYQFFPPPELDGMYDGRELPLPPEADNWVGVTDGHFYPKPFRALYQDYLECLFSLDREIGRVLDTLDEENLFHNTIVVYASDNGFLWGEHHLTDKRWAYEESIRIPLIMRHPGVIPDPGRRTDRMALSIDLAPTLLEAAGIQPRVSMEGESLLPILKSAGAPGRTSWLYEYFVDYPYSIPPIRAVRTDRYKYIDYDEVMEPDLFDIIADPRETTNLMDTDTGRRILPELKALLEHHTQGEIP